MNLLKAFRERLWLKVLAALQAVLILVIGTIIGLNLHRQIRLLKEQNRHDNRMLAAAIEGSMIDALAVGDNRSVVQQFKRIKQSIGGLDVFIFDFEGEVAFATDEAAVGRDVRQLQDSADAARMVSAMLETGEEPKAAYEQTTAGRPCLSIYRPILNRSRCYHCHGSSRKVLGGMQVQAGIDKVYAGAAASRNTAAVVGLAGVGALLLCIYWLFQRMVNQPIRRMLAFAGKMRQGDLTGRMKVIGRDEISHMGARLNVVNESLSELIEKIVNSSESLSKASAEQAAPVQQTSASLETMAAMTRKTADNVKDADKLMRSANDVFVQAGRSMSELTESMEDLAHASDDTSKIIKTIDEIAFQTNLLALNAAVEAARAGEAGSGFAVVADEVRNLALKTTEAARETAGLIEATVKRIKQGKALVGDTDRSFQEMTGAAGKVGELLAEIAVASKEQSQGIAQINQAVGEIEKATQTNVGHTERLVGLTSRFRVTAKGDHPGSGPQRISSPVDEGGAQG